MKVATSEDYQLIVCKFLINLPREQLEDVNRLSFHVEKAFFYYLDYVVKEKDPKDWQAVRSQFLAKIKEKTPTFIKMNTNVIISKILENKPVCGAIIFNKENSKVLVIRVNNKLGFPKGKLNQTQTFQECAVREVQEQTGINIQNKIDSRIRLQFDNHGGSICFFVARGVSEYERIKIDKNQIDEVLWMPVQDVKRELNARFVQRSKIAWALYERDYAKKVNSELYAPKYFKKDSVQFDYQINPLKQFKFDKARLFNAFNVPSYMLNNNSKKL